MVYCKDDNRPGSYPRCKFDFLGYTFRPRGAKNRKGKTFVSFLPAVSRGAAKALRQKLAGLGLQRRSGGSLEDPAKLVNPFVRGWINYFGRFYRSALYTVFDWLDRILAKWAMRKYKRLKRRWGRAWLWLRAVRRRQPSLFAHWVPLGAMAGR